jgi:WD40 repeat protein
VSSGAPIILDVESGRPIYQMPLPKDYYAEKTLLSPDGKWLATSTHAFVYPNHYDAFYIVDTQTKQEKKLNEVKIIDFKFSADSTLLVTMTYELGAIQIKVYETGRWKIKNEFEVRGYDSSNFGVSPDNKLIAMGSSEIFEIFSLETGEFLAAYYHQKNTFLNKIFHPGHNIPYTNQVEFSPNGKLLLTGGFDTVKLWSLE